MDKLFSIIMPAWNRAEIIKMAIDSVLAQTVKDYELIIIDDGSEDDLPDVLSPYGAENIIYHRIPHSGVSAARNFALRLARGKYIAYLDSDNRWHSDFLSIMYKALSRSLRRKKFAYCKCNFFKKNPKNGLFSLDSVIGSHFRLKKLLSQNYIDLNSIVHLRTCIEEIGVFDEKLKRLVDWDFILRLGIKYQPLFVKKVLVDYYFSLAQNTISDNEDLGEPFEIIRRKYKQREDRSVSLHHDAMAYKWEKVPETKYINWVRINQPNSIRPDFMAWGFPHTLQIEPTNLCNLLCPLCPAGLKDELNRKRRHMTLEEFKSIIDNIQQYLLFVILWDWGEPLMNPALPEMIQYASERGIRVVTSTNAHFLQNQEYVRRILKSGLATLIIAIDSLCDEKYTVYRKGGHLQQAISGLQNVVNAKKQLNSTTRLNLRMVIMKSNEHELAEMRKLARGLKVDKFTVKTVNPSCGLNSMDREIIPENPEYRRYAYQPGTYERIRIDVPCTRVWRMSNIFSNGDIVPCCYDYNSEMKVGNVFEKPFTEIWNSPAYRDLRKRIYYEKDSIPKCRACTINFKLSKVGWFVEAHDYNVGVKGMAFDLTKRFLKFVLPKGIVAALREIR